MYYLPALSAMVKHDQEEEEIDLREEPIGFLLSLCDEIQDWERPSLDLLPFKERVAAAIRFGTSLGIVGNSMRNSINIDLPKKMNPFTGSGKLSGNNNINFVLDYSGAVDQKDFYSIYTWLLKCYKLQRLNQQGALDISFKFITGYKKPLPEFHRLILRRHKIREWSFEDWLKLVKGPYVYDNGKETMTVRLKDLWDNVPIKENPMSFLKKIIYSGRIGM